MFYNFSTVEQKVSFYRSENIAKQAYYYFYYLLLVQ